VGPEGEFRDTTSYERRRVNKKGIGFKVEPSDMAYVNEAELDLLRAQIRVSALGKVVASTNGGAISVPVGLFPLAEIRGRFTLLPDGSYHVDVPSPPSDK
jgi:hypothetical protein